jgi:xanthine/CO dehydrogenase XdhC/CoxF family maturation factor
VAGPSIELDVIARDAAALRARGVPFVLATVVRVEGSSYRRAGARMLIAEARWIAGCVSGGCLEADVVRRAEFRTRDGPAVVRYDSTSDDGIGWGVGLGCNGVVEVLLERIDDGTALDPTRFVEECLASEDRGVIATVFASGDDAIRVGARLFVRREAVTASSIPEGPARDAIATAALAMSRANEPRGHELCVGTVAVLVEPIAPVPRLFVVGSGHDAVPVVALARTMGFRSTVTAAHGSVALRERFAAADCVLVGSPATIARAVDAHETSLVVIMTHDYDRDRECLGAVLGTRARYIGVLGPERRTARMLSELAESGLAIADDVLARLHAPVGLDLGAETPREIALAIIAEVQATLTSAPARRLRERAGPIHPPGRNAPATIG